MYEEQKLTTTLLLTYFTFQTASVFSVVALAMMFPALTVLDVIKPFAIALAMLPPPINPTFSSSAILKIRPQRELRGRLGMGVKILLVQNLSLRKKSPVTRVY